MDPLSIPNWGYYDQPASKGNLGNLGLQLMSMAPERDTKPLMSNGGFLHHRDCGIPDFHHHRDCGMPEPPIMMEFGRDGWMHRDNKMLHVLPMSHHHSNYSFLLPEPEPPVHTVQMMQVPEHTEDEMSPQSPLDEPKKKRQGSANKLPKAKKPRKVAAPKDDATNWSPAKAGKKNAGLVINGIDLDISKIATPVCSCTGAPQQCYRWGAGGWQSACCTTTISEHPLPMSTKRRGARIAGRKMSQGAFKKVLEKLVGEGYNLANPIDLKGFWAKHGTNKFVTIR